MNLENEIEEIRGFEHDKLPNLQTLEIRDNKLKSTKGIRLPNLKSLFIVGFSISIVM
jgi:Leucine-rich repeat (LRR) protein